MCIYTALAFWENYFSPCDFKVVMLENKLEWVMENVVGLFIAVLWTDTLHYWGMSVITETKWNSQQTHPRNYVNIVEEFIFLID